MPLDPTQIADRLTRLPGWRVENNALVREYATGGWPGTLMAVNAIGFLAEAADHHPDLLARWGELRVTIWTHSEGGITESDFALAQEIERLALWRPDSQSPLRGIRRDWIRPKS